MEEESRVPEVSAPAEGPPEAPAGEDAERVRFIVSDAREFLRRFPDVDLGELDASEAFHRFCGSRYGRESLAELYEDYLAVAGESVRAARTKDESRRARSTGSGGSGSFSPLNARQQEELDAWNRAFPQMRMTAKEYLTRNN
jgi:hypothetical protein